jgi:hypothetical protein
MKFWFIGIVPKYLSFSTLFTDLLPIVMLWSWMIISRHNHMINFLSIYTPYTDEICVFLGYCTASRGDCWPTFRDNVCVPSSRVQSPNLEDGTDTLSRNIRKQLPHDAA